MPDDPLIRWETDGGATRPPDDDSGRAGRVAPEEVAIVGHEACGGAIDAAPETESSTDSGRAGSRAGSALA